MDRGFGPYDHCPWNCDVWIGRHHRHYDGNGCKPSLEPVLVEPIPSLIFQTRVVRSTVSDIVLYAKGEMCSYVELQIHNKKTFHRKKILPCRISVLSCPCTRNCAKNTPPEIYHSSFTFLFSPLAHTSLFLMRWKY